MCSNDFELITVLFSLEMEQLKDSPNINLEKIHFVHFGCCCRRLQPFSGERYTICSIIREKQQAKFFRQFLHDFMPNRSINCSIPINNCLLLKALLLQLTDPASSKKLLPDLQKYNAAFVSLVFLPLPLQRQVNEQKVGYGAVEVNGLILSAYFLGSALFRVDIIVS